MNQISAAVVFQGPHQVGIGRLEMPPPRAGEIQIRTRYSGISGGTEGYRHAATVIGDNCYIGPNAVIAKGVRIGSGCIIGAQSLVLADIPDGSKAYGTPCRVAGPATPDNPGGFA